MSETVYRQVQCQECDGKGSLGVYINSVEGDYHTTRACDRCSGVGCLYELIIPNPLDEIERLKGVVEDARMYGLELIGLAAKVAAVEAKVARFRSLVRQNQAFIGVMFGQGEDAEIPELVTTPLGVPVKLGEIMRETRNALNGEPEQTVG